ncbi:MAG: DUF4158 domain-containing protein [Kofleriaceae bacterium]|nr:DUF4158 domain-containing protein [Kofleriaceae bacterium]
MSERMVGVVVATNPNDSRRGLKFSTDPIQEELLGHWTLSKSDKTQVRLCRGTAQRYYFALQLCILRHRGHFMSADQTRVPRFATHKEHRKRIRSYLKFRTFDQAERALLFGTVLGRRTLRLASIGRCQQSPGAESARRSSEIR